MRVDRGAGSGGGAPGLGEHLLCAFCYAQRHLLPGQGCDDHTAGLGSEGAGTGVGLGMPSCWLQPTPASAHSSAACRRGNACRAPSSYGVTRPAVSWARQPGICALGSKPIDVALGASGDRDAPASRMKSHRMPVLTPEVPQRTGRTRKRLTAPAQASLWDAARKEGRQRAGSARREFSGEFF